MAYQGPSYGLSRECMLKAGSTFRFFRVHNGTPTIGKRRTTIATGKLPIAQAKFDMDQALLALEWIQNVTSLAIEAPDREKGFKDQFDFADVLKDGLALCTLINKLCPGAVSKINTMKAPFKQRENLEMFLKGCENYGLKRHDLFQVNDLYERKNLYTVVNCLFALGGLAKKKGYNGATIGVKMADENKRCFSKEILNMGKTVIGLQSGTNQCASQKGMTPYGSTRQILPDGR